MEKTCGLENRSGHKLLVGCNHDLVFRCHLKGDGWIEPLVSAGFNGLR
jgi:hypothetical protein